jgi:uncharacterized membrane protein/sporulation protein YlmC with PRC-barrel domain
MINFPIDARVECKDGPCGESVTVIVDPTIPEITHFVVQTREAEQRMVPIDQVVETTAKSIRLCCTTDQVAEMTPFVERHYVDEEFTTPGYWYSMNDVYYVPYAMPVQPIDTFEDVEQTPEGEQAIHRGTLVEATDGYVGQVSELVIDPTSRKITHFVVQEGHLWGKKDLTLPLSVIDKVEHDTVFLKLDKKAVAQLPAIPLKRSHRRKDVETKSVELVGVLYEKLDGANDGLEFVEDLHRRKTLKILNAAVLIKDEDGKASVKDTRDIDPKKGRLLGAITGGLIGLVGGPVGVVVGALTGLGAGNLAGKWIDMGFSDKFLENLQQYLQPGSSALIVLVEHEWAVSAAKAMAELEGVVIQQTLTDTLVEDLIETSETEG